ncbi:hypothetical protein SDC9_189873 [bioreactor metagenome]|uniref:Uncharacterized protein n=1 Tax=bioreactor metagenome TaxID=1076179 RepID=A0A645HUR5_9ZZZZ
MLSVDWRDNPNAGIIDFDTDFSKYYLNREGKIFFSKPQNGRVLVDLDVEIPKNSNKIE